MNVVVIGSGGREHALVDKICESSKLENLFTIPGNPGTDEIGKNVELDLNDHNKISKICEENNIDLVVIGPEQPLVSGLADHLRNKNINVFGPNKDAMHVIDKRTLEIVKTLRPSPGKTAAHVEFTRDGKYALLSIWDPDGAVIVYDAETLKEIKRLPMNKPSGKYNVFNKTRYLEGTSH